MLLSVLRLQIEGVAHRTAEASVGRVRERVVEGRERMRAHDVELEFLVEPCVGDRDLQPVGRLVPEQGDLEAFVLAAREFFPGGVYVRGVHDSSFWLAAGRVGHGISTSLMAVAVVRSAT